MQYGSHHIALSSMPRLESRSTWTLLGGHCRVSPDLTSHHIPINGAQEEGTKNDRVFDAASATPSSALTAI